MERERVIDYAIGVDLGCTQIKTVAVSDTGERLFEACDVTVDAAGAWRERIRERIADVENALGERTARIGLASPGLAARDERSIAWMQGRMAAVQGLDWTDLLGADRTVPVMNDAHAALLGESWIGAAAGCENVALLTLGTGVGGAVLVDGRLLRGHLGRAGHLGHLCLDPDGEPDIVGTPGSLESMIGDYTVRSRGAAVSAPHSSRPNPFASAPPRDARRVGQADLGRLGRPRFSSTRDLVDAHCAGDSAATAVWLRSVYQLACGIVSILNVLDPEVVVIGGGVAQAGNALFEPLGRFLDRLEWRPFGPGVPVRPAVLGELAGAIGAARRAMTMHTKECRASGWS